VLVTLADACVELADAGAAAVLYDALRPFAARFTVAAGAVACLGSVELPLGALAALLGDDDAARRHFDAAVRIHRSARAPGFLVLSCRAYAEHLDRPADAALARSLREESQRLAIAYGLTPTTPDVALTLQRDGAVWTVRRGTAVVRLPDSRGLGYLAALVGNPGRDIPAVQLAGLSGDDGAPPAPAFEDGLASPPASSFDPVLDEPARAAYRQRLRDLEQDIDEAAGWHDTGRLAQLKAERDFLVRKLASSLGLGGRARRFTSDAEKARVNVTRAIRSAIAKISEQAPDIGEHLSTAISTGYNCRYEPTLTRTARV